MISEAFFIKLCIDIYYFEKIFLIYHYYKSEDNIVDFCSNVEVLLILCELENAGEGKRYFS